LPENWIRATINSAEVCRGTVDEVADCTALYVADRIRDHAARGPLGFAIAIGKAYRATVPERQRTAGESRERLHDSGTKGRHDVA
jgi:hypothetical protein